MLLTVFLATVFCGAITLLLISAVAFVQDNRFFSSAPKEVQELIKPRSRELFHGARAMGWTLMIISALMILCVGVISIWDGFRNGFSFMGFFLRFVLIFTIYKAYDMIFFDWFLLCDSTSSSITTLKQSRRSMAGSMGSTSKASC